MKSSTTTPLTESFGLLLQGPPGGGKTSLSVCFPRPYIISADNNLGGVLRRMKAQAFTKEIFYDLVHLDDEGKDLLPLNSLSGIYTAQWKRFLALLGKSAADPTIDSIIIDNMSSLSDICLRFIMDDVRRLEGKAIERLRIQDYQPNQMIWRELCMRARTFNKFIVVIAHEEAEKDELTGIVKYKPNVPGAKLQGQLGGFFSDIWRCETKTVNEKPVYVVRTQPAPRADLKTSIITPTELTLSESFAENEKLVNQYLKPGK